MRHYHLNRQEGRIALRILCLWLCALIYHSCQEAVSEARSSRPNILFIAIDDLNDWVGCLAGHPQIKTPNIDRLAREGVLFANAHCQSPICNPSRTSLLTGLRPSSTGIYGLSPWIRDVDSLQDITTLPQFFSQNGYKTYSTGKIFHGGYGRRPSDTEFDSLGPGTSITPRPKEKIVGFTPGGNHSLMDWGTFPHQDEEKGDWQVASWAVEVLQSNPRDPFFLSVGFFLPHVPLHVTKKWWDMYPYETLQMPPVLERDRDDTPRFSWYIHWNLPEPRLKWLKESGQWRPKVRSYLAAVSFIDSQVGRVLQALDSSGLGDNTIVVLWSDHGYHLGEKLLSGKNTLWEQSTRVPLIFRGPGIGQSTYRYPVELLDIYPTLADLCDLPVPSHLEGHSLVRQLRDTTVTRMWPAITTDNFRNHSVRSRDWRYIRYADGSEELYDLVNDPNEWTNLSSDPSLVDQKQELAKWLPGQNHTPHIGNNARVLQYIDGRAIWEGEEIGEDDPIPGVEVPME